MLLFVFIVCVCALPGARVGFAEDDDAQIEIATYNIRYANRGDGKDVWPNRRAAVIAYVGRNEIVGLQEVTKSQLNDLTAGLPQFDYYGVGRDDGKSGGEHAPIFYRKERFEVINKGTFWLSETPDKIGVAGWDAALPRTCTWIHFRDRKSGQAFLVANTHFDHRGAKARAESGKLIARRIADLAGDLPVIVMGDLNCLPDSEPYNAIAASFVDARSTSQTRPVGPNSTWNGFSEIVPDRIIDHVFVRKFNVLQLATEDPKTDNGRFASDHLPVKAIVRWDAVTKN